MKVLVFNGSPRRKGNTSHLAAEFLRGAAEAGAETEEIIADQINIDYCAGCLRCNMIKRCSNKGDDWPALSQKIRDADVLVMASPVYFHHVTASLKKILDRFRSFLHVGITGTDLVHTPWNEWKKQWVLILSQGSPAPKESEPVADLFKFFTSTLGPENTLHTIIGTRLAISGQVVMPIEKLLTLYKKLEIPQNLAAPDAQRNKTLLDSCFHLGKKLSR
ncbi:MAG: flavodoxin family protein [bacterium]|nr:flavodoxin family protein [bacterium]